jgi:gluconokinase
MEYILGIDIGTGSTKAVAISLKGETLAVHQVYYEIHSPKGGYSEQNPEEIWLAFKTCLVAVSDLLACAPLSVGLSSAMHSLILVDNNIQPISQVITWADSRSADTASRIKASSAGRGLYTRTGTPIHAMSPLCKINWIKENEPLLFARTNHFLSIKEYIWYQLFGELKIDHSIASCTGLFNILDVKWDKPALDLAGVEAHQLSAPVPTNYSKTGIYISEERLSVYAHTEFVIGASDGCLANLGSFATAPGIAALTIGTSAAIRIASRQPIINFESMTFNYKLDDDLFICGGPINNGGSAVRWLLKNVFHIEELTDLAYDHLFDSIAKVDAGSRGLVFLPYLAGERAPLWNTESCGTFFGLKPQHDQSHLSRAVLEGICFSLYDVLQVVENNSEAITQLNVSGGFIQSEVWMQILADVTGKKLVIIQEEDASAMGAAYLAAKTSGLSISYQQDTLRSILPNMDVHKVYKEIFPIFKELYTSLSPLMLKLHQLNR